MNINALADEVLTYLETKHQRVYRNKAPSTIIVNNVKIPTPFPYVVFRIDSVTNTMPSEDYYLNIDIYEDVNKSVREMEDLADSIDGDSLIFDKDNNPKIPTGLNQKVINTSTLNLHFDREQRQYIEANELVSAQAINIRYVVRAYFK